MRRLISLSLIITLCLSLTACSKPAADHPDSPSSEAAAMETEAVPTEFVPETEPAPAPWETPIEFTWNPYTYTNFLPELYGEDAAEDYVNMIDAFMNYEETFEYKNEDFLFDRGINTNALFPFFDGTIYGIQLDEGTATIDYFYDEATHMAKLAEFEAKITDIIRSCIMQSDTDAEAAIALYAYLTDYFTYDEDAADDNGDVTDVSSLRAIMECKGICQSFAGAYSYLLTQLGIDSVVVGGSDGDSAHEWNWLRLDDEYYFADITFENSNGHGLAYFGMDLPLRLSTYSADPSLLNVMNILRGDAIHAEDLRFVPLQTIVSLTSINRSAQGMSFTGFDISGEEITVDLLVPTTLNDLANAPIQDSSVNQNPHHEDDHHSKEHHGDNHAENHNLMKLHQCLEEEHAVCASAYICYNDGNDSHCIDEAIKNLVEKNSFLKDIDAEHRILEGGDEIYCIVPSTNVVSVEIFHYDALKDNYDTEEIEDAAFGDTLYSVWGNDPFYLSCNVSDIMPDRIIIFTTDDGKKIYYSPSISLKDGSNYVPDYVCDFTCYE